MKTIKNSKRLKLKLFVILIWSVTSVLAQDNSGVQNSLAINLNDDELSWGGCPEFMPEGCKISVLRGDPAAKNSDILFKVPANSDIPLHWHNSAERMVLISGEMEVTYKGEKK